MVSLAYGRNFWPPGQVLPLVGVTQAVYLILLVAYLVAALAEAFGRPAHFHYAGEDELLALLEEAALFVAGVGAFEFADGRREQGLGRLRHIGETGVVAS